jgi:hypothetical protein
MIDEEQIRLFNELMSTQPGEQIEGLASRYPDVFEKPRVNEIPDPLNMKGRIADSERKRKEQEEAEFQAKYGQKTILDMARPEFIPDDITAAIKAIGTLGSGAGAGIKGMIGEAFGMDPEATVQRNIYFPDVLEKAKSGQKLTPDEERELAFYGRYIDKSLEGFKTVGDALESPMRAYEESKLDALMFMPGTRNISMIDDVIEMGIRGARDVAPIVKPAIQSAGQAARLAIRDDLLPLTQKATQATKEYFETPPVGAISLDTLGFSSRLSEGVDKLQDKGTGPQFLAQLSKMKGVPLAEIKVTGLDEYLKNTPKVTKQEVQDYLETNRLQLIEDERIAGAGRLSKEQVNTLPSEFDWLDREDLNEGFENKAHLRNHLIVTLNRHFDDLELQAADTGSFYARDRSGEVRYIPESRKFQWLDSEQDRIDEVLSELPDFNSATKYPDEHLIPGGENYREILYKLPDDKVEGVFRSPHFDNADNTFGSIRATDRTIDGTPTLFAEEIQSDWAIAGAKRGYQSAEELAATSARRQDLQAQFDEAAKQFDEAKQRFDNRTPMDSGLELLRRMELAAEKADDLRQELEKLGKKGVPDNPFRGNWYKPVINNFLVKAAQEGKGGIGFPVGEIVKDRYNLANVVDRIESSTDRTVYPTPLRGGPFKTVTIDLKPALAGANEKQMSLRVDKDGLVRGVNADQYNRFIGKPLTEVVGKGVSEKILSNDSQVMTDLDLKIGGEGKDKLYDDMLPKHLNEIGKRYGVQLEKRTTSSADVYFMPITEEMRNDILSEGLPMFKQGGSVKKFAPGGKVLKEVAKGASDAAKAAQKARRTPQLEQFLDKSKVKEQMYRGQRRAPQATGFALTQGRGTPSFTTDPEVANVYSRQLGWGSPEYGPGSTVMPAYLQMENPLDLRSYGEHITLSDFIENLPNVDLSKARVNNGFGYEDVAEMVRGIGSVAGKTGAQYEIEAASPGTPFRMKEFGELADAIEEMGAAGKPETIDMMLFDTSIDAFLIGDSKNVRNALKDAGYDGVIHKDAFDVGGEYYQGDKKNLEGGNYAEYIHDSYRPFFQEKIKSSIGNVGEYDITNPDITKAKGGALRSVTSGAQRAAKEGQKMLQGVYRGYTGERLEEPVLSTTPQRKVAEYYATRRAATRGEDPHIEMLMVDPFVGKEYGLALPIDEFNRELLTTRARAIAPSDVVERTQLKKKGGLACLSK